MLLWSKVSRYSFRTGSDFLARGDLENMMTLVFSGFSFISPFGTPLCQLHILTGNGMCLTGNGNVPHREWGCASPGMGMRLIGNGIVPHREWECASPGMGMCLTGNGNAHPHREWECTSSPGMGMCLIGNAHPHRECTQFIHSALQYIIQRCGG